MSHGIGLEDAAARLAADPDLVDVAGALYRATHEAAPCTLLVAECDAPTWREHTWHLGNVEIVPSTLLEAGRARVVSRG